MTDEEMAEEYLQSFETDEEKALSKVDITVDVQPDTQTKSVTLIENGTTTITPDTDKLLSSVNIEVAVPIETGRTETITQNGTVLIEPGAIYSAMEDVEVTVDVPLEANKEVSVDIEDYTDPIEITPTSGNDGMEKTTITLTNLTRLYAWQHTGDNHIMYTTFSTVSKSNGTAYQCPQVKNAQLAVKLVLVNGDGLYVEGYPNSVYYRYPDADIS